MGADTSDGTAYRSGNRAEKMVQKNSTYTWKRCNNRLGCCKTYWHIRRSPFVWHRMPGFGDTNWRDIISILRSNGYEDDICIEGYHDPVYSGELEMTGQLHALNYLKWCRGGDFTPTPWAK